MSGTTGSAQPTLAPETPHNALSRPSGGPRALGGLLSLPARAARYEALTPLERAFLRACGALWQAGLAAALAAVGDAAFQQMSAHGGLFVGGVAALSWPALAQVAQVAFLTAVITGAAKLVRASGDPLIADAGAHLLPLAPQIGAALVSEIDHVVSHGVSGTSGAGEPDDGPDQDGPEYGPEYGAEDGADLADTNPALGALPRVADWPSGGLKPWPGTVAAAPPAPVATPVATPVAGLTPVSEWASGPVAVPVLEPSFASASVTGDYHDYQSHLRADDGPPTIVSAKVVAQVTPPTTPEPTPAPKPEPEPVKEPVKEPEPEPASEEEPHMSDADLAALQARVEEARAALEQALAKAHPGMSAADHKAESWAR